MRFFVLAAALFLTVYTVYASPVGRVPPKPGNAIRKMFDPLGNGFVPRDLSPRTYEDNPGPDYPPNRHFMAYEKENIGTVLKTLAPRETLDKNVISQIISLFNKGPPDRSFHWSMGSQPSWHIGSQQAVQARLEPYGEVFIVAIASIISDKDMDIRRELYAAILLIQQNDCLDAWAREKIKNDEYKYYIVVMDSDLCRHIGTLPLPVGPLWSKEIWPHPSKLVTESKEDSESQQSGPRRPDSPGSPSSLSSTSNSPTEEYIYPAKLDKKGKEGHSGSPPQVIAPHSPPRPGSPPSKYGSNLVPYVILHMPPSAD